MKLEFLRLKNGRDLPLPAPQTAGAAGMDLCAAEEVVVVPGEVVVVGTGFAIAIPDGCEVQVRPRSGLAVNHGITLINSPGTIDSDYRGEVRVPLINHGKKSYRVRRGERIAQMVVAQLAAVTAVEVTTLSATVRGQRGFGSTGNGLTGEGR